MAKLAGKSTISLDKLSQDINLKKLLGRKPTRAEKKAFAELAVEQINQRTLDGENIHGNNFKKYSKKYADLKGVSRDSVDMFLEGDMLGAVKGKTNKEDTVTIDVKGGKKNINIKKGFAHQTGDGQKKRQWFGITTDEARTIAEAIRESETTSINDILTTTAATTETKSGFSLAELRAGLSELGLEQIE